MADNEAKTVPGAARDAAGEPEKSRPPSGVRLTKRERKELLARLEKVSSRAHTPEEVLRRGEQALQAGQLERARRALEQLEGEKREVPGLDLYRERLYDALDEKKARANQRAAEEMLRRYIQQRRKPLAKLALQTLLELNPAHPRRRDYEVWVADLDLEVAVQQQIDRHVAAGRAAAAAGDFPGATKHLRALRKIDSSAAATEEFARELEVARMEQAESDDIERAKERFEELLRAGDVEHARRQLEVLARMDIPKLTIDFLHKRLDQHLSKRRDQLEAESLERDFEVLLNNGDWQGARDLVQRYDRRFPNGSRPGEMFRHITELEAAERRRESLRQGLETLERFLAEGRRDEAEVALKLLHSLDLDPARFAKLERRVKAL